MAKQTGIFKIEGTIGGVTFYKTADGYLAKEATIISADRIATDPSYQRTRENNAEFARAGIAAKTLRTAFRAQLQLVQDTRMYNRLTSEMLKVIKSDSTSTRGMRNVVDGELEMLQGFDFNSNSKLASTLYAPYQASIDRGTGKCTSSIPAFVPAHLVSAPAGATHFQINTVGTEIDFEAETFTTDSKGSGILPLDNAETAAMNIECLLPAGSTHPLLLAVGIEFLQMVNNEYYSLRNGAYNAMALVKVLGL